MRRDIFLRDEKQQEPVFVIKPEITFNPFKHVLEFPPGGLNYDKIIETPFIEISPKVSASNLFKEAPMLRTIEGRVYDETNQPMPSASLSVVGDTATGTSTDFDGNYSLTLKKGSKVEVRFIGYQTQIFPWNNIPQIIRMKTDVSLLDEVVLPTVKKKSKTLLYAGIGIGVLALAFLLKIKATGLKGATSKTCTNRAKCTGVKKNGRLKKGYRFGKGGKVIKTNKAGLKAANITL